MIYVDRPGAVAKHIGCGMFRYPVKYCHLFADSPEELRAFANLIGLSPEWLQCAGTYREHYDLMGMKINAAIKAGAKRITFREVGRLLKAKREAR